MTKLFEAQFSVTEEEKEPSLPNQEIKMKKDQTRGSCSSAWPARPRAHSATSQSPSEGSLLKGQ